MHPSSSTQLQLVWNKIPLCVWSFVCFFACLSFGQPTDHSCCGCKFGCILPCLCSQATQLPEATAQPRGARGGWARVPREDPREEASAKGTKGIQASRRGSPEIPGREPPTASARLHAAHGAARTLVAGSVIFAVLFLTGSVIFAVIFLTGSVIFVLARFGRSVSGATAACMQHLQRAFVEHAATPNFDGLPSFLRLFLFPSLNGWKKEENRSRHEACPTACRRACRMPKK